ncbi:hypothetical protein EVAR_57722_1 [Eumeta japonica]|uniref:Helitron helicase-like domain-containing protein n=1 Tax=Eumeta variegata TaxID=151549 RepID=A0A4C1Y5Z5_EUMVA|nr:hypothetical protein EVAR_57722_1 [Eumeta japonica]
MPAIGRGPAHAPRAAETPADAKASPWSDNYLSKMDEENQIDDKLKRKRELNNARVKKHREKRRTESQQLNFLMRNDPTKQMQNKQVKDNCAERKRAMAKERSRRYREKKRLNVLKPVHYVIHDSQISGPLHGNPPPVLRNQRIHDSQIAGTSTDMGVPLVRDDLENLNRIVENVSSPLYEENQPVHINDNLVPLKDQVCTSPTLNVQFIRSSATYSAYVRHSSAHVQFHKQFIQNEFGYACKICDRLWFKDRQFLDNKHDEEFPPNGCNENDKECNCNDLEHIPIDESLLAQQQTLMWNEDLYLRIGPGENNLPLSLLFDEYAEELSFPSIYLGQFRQFRKGVTVTPFMMATSELRRSDRRGVTPQHLLYLAMKIMRIRLSDSFTIAFKHIGKKCNITKEEIKSGGYIHNCIESNFAFLRSIPNSTWYWSERKKDLFAMIRQLGKPTVFFTISANEIGWLDLLQLLYKVKTRVNITKEEISQLHYMAKSTLINEDTVTCAIYFNKLVNVVMNILQSKTCSPFQKYRVRHYFKRIEFQHRGSPHAHILAWLDNAPKDALNEDYEKAIELIDTLISVSAVEASGNIKLQTHKHTFTCYKKTTAKKTQKCRFETPFMPCKKTIILTPMKNTEEGFINYQKRYAQIKVRLENEDFEDMDNFYNRNGISSDEEYYNIIKAGVTIPKVFVKREPSEKWHNPFNPFVLNVVLSSTNFQFITEEYSCAAYVIECINKTNRGVSHLQRKMTEIVNECPEFDNIDIIKNISVNILNHTEITSQEAAWYLLRVPMSKTSVNIVYIPTVWPIERQRIRKTMKELSELDDDCSDVWKENWFDKYEKRPENLENITLSQFVSKYTQNREKDYIERREPEIIRYRNYDMTVDFNEYRREMVTLHLPFRNEQEEILAGMKFVTIYNDNEDIILQRRKQFESDNDIDKTIQICRELCHEEIPVNAVEIQDSANRL